MNIKAKIEEIEKEIAELKKQVEAQGQEEFPRIDECYSFINDEGEVGETYWVNDITDKFRQLMGNIYKTEREAEIALETKIKYFEMARDSWNGKKIDWNDMEQPKSKYSLYYYKCTLSIEIKEDINFQHLPDRYYFADRQTLTDAIKELGKENIKKYIIEV